MKEIILNARYGLKHTLNKVDDKVYKLNIDPKGGQSFRMGKVDGKHHFIDPDGGPFMVEGEKIPGTDYDIDKFKFIENQGYCIIIK